MKTGIIRRIDDLGRVVIPKDVRRTLLIQEGDPFEITYDKDTGSVTFTKYVPERTGKEILDDLKTWIEDTYACGDLDEMNDLLKQVKALREAIQKKETDHGEV